MRSPGRAARRRVALVVILVAASSTPRNEARSGDDGPGQPAVERGGQATPSTVEDLLQEAIVAAEDAQDPDALRTMIAATLARAGHADEALRLADGVPEDQDRRLIIRAIAFAQARSGDFDGASRTSRMLPDPEFRNVTTFLAALRAWAGDVPGAERMIEADLGDRPESVYASRMMAAALEQQGRYADAVRIYEAIPSLLEQARGRRPAALARLEEGDIEGALRAAEESRRLATDYLEQKPPHRGQASSMSPQIEPDWFRNDILAEIALEQARRGDALGARETAGEISWDSPRAITAARAAAILAREGDRASARGLIEWASAWAEQAGYRGFELMEIASAEAQAGDLEAARETFIRALGTVGPAVMNQAIIPAAQARAGDVEGAMQSLDAIRDAGARQRALRYIAAALASDGAPLQAVQIAGSLTDPAERARSLREVAEAQDEAGDRSGALITIRRAAEIEGDLGGETLRSLACELARLGDAGEALEWVDDRSTRATKAWGLLGVAEGLLPRMEEGPNLFLPNS